MANKIKLNLSLNGNLAGQSDPVGISIADWELSTENPSLTSATRNTVNGSPFEILGTSAAPAIGGYTHYVYVCINNRIYFYSICNYSRVINLSSTKSWYAESNRFSRNHINIDIIEILI